MGERKKSKAVRPRLRWVEIAFLIATNVLDLLFLVWAAMELMWHLDTGGVRGWAITTTLSFACGLTFGVVRFVRRFGQQNKHDHNDLPVLLLYVQDGVQIWRLLTGVWVVSFVWALQYRHGWSFAPHSNDTHVADLMDWQIFMEMSAHISIVSLVLSAMYYGVEQQYGKRKAFEPTYETVPPEMPSDDDEDSSDDDDDDDEDGKKDD